VKTPGQIAQKLKQIRFRRTKRELSRLLKESGANCAHNFEASARNVSLRVCRLDEKACDSRFRDRSKECGKFQQRHTAEDLKNSLRDFFAEASLEDLSIRFPVVAILQWVLEGEDVPGAPNQNPFPSAEIEGRMVWAETEEDLQTVAQALKDEEDRADDLHQRIMEMNKEISISPSDSLQQFRTAVIQLRQDVRTAEYRARTGMGLAQALAKALDEDYDPLSSEDPDKALQELTTTLLNKAEELMRPPPSPPAPQASFQWWNPLTWVTR